MHITQIFLLLVISLVPITKNPVKEFDKPVKELKQIRVFVKPEQVGLPKDFPFPVVKDRIFWKCPCCNMKMSTHVVYPSNPNCPRLVNGKSCGCFMNELK